MGTLKIKIIFIFFLVSILFFGCKSSEDSSSATTDADSSTTGTDTTSSSLASSIISELESNLSSSSSSRTGRVSTRPNSKTLSNNLNPSQISQIKDAALQAVSSGNLGESEDLIQLMPKIIEGAQGKLSDLGLSDSSEAINVINVIVNSMVKSVNGRSQYLPSSSAESGATATETVFKKITSTSVSNLDEAGLSSSDIGKASSELVSTVVGSLGSGGISSSEIGGALDKITAGAVDSLDQISGFDVSSLGPAIDNITGGATAALGDIEVEGFSAENLTEMIEKVTSGATSALGEISISGYSADNLSQMVEKVTAGATGALGKIKMDGYDSTKLTGMIEKVTAGATSSLGKIKMDGYDAADLSEMIEKVTSGATVALGNIEMDGFSADNLSSMVEKVTSGATAAMGDIQMDGFSADNLTSMVEKVTSGATASLGKIKMEGYDSTKLTGMIEKVTAGATSSLGKIKMDGYDAADLSEMIEKVTSGATVALGNIEMDGFSADNLSSMVEKVTSGATAAMGDIQMDGFSADNLTSMVEKVTSGATASLGKIKMEGYDSTKLTGMIEKVTAGATAALGNIEMEGFSLDNFTALSLSITNSAIESLGEINLSGFDKDNISSEIISAINVGSNSGKMKQPPILTEIKSISTPTNDNTPIYTFSSSKAGLITYGGMCSSDTTLANKDNNTITLNFLSDGTYSNCTINVTDNNSKKGNTLFLKLFTIDTKAPILLQETAVTSPNNDATPSYSFSSNEAGIVSYGGSCSSGTSSASSGTNTIIFDSLSDGSHDCTITITDSAGNASSALSVNTFVVDTVAPIISQSMAVTTPTIDTTPNYIFTSTEAGTINYGGSCSSGTTLATSGNVSITFEALSEGSYSDCTISITDSAGNKSNTLSINSFIITSVIEIEQTNEGDGYFTGSFEVPEDGISFLLSTFKDDNTLVKFYSLTDPDGINILSSSSVLFNNVSGSYGKDGYANVLVPQTPGFSAKSGTWKFESNNNDRVKLVMRSGTTPTNAIIVVQPYITGTTWSANDISEALDVMWAIYAKNGITIDFKSTITISDSQFSTVSRYPLNPITSTLISKGKSDAVNLFFIEDYSDASLLGNAAGIPGSMKMSNSWNGVLNSLSAHATGSTLNSNMLGETAAHEMGHQLGLFHLNESEGTLFDILSDTPECGISRDSDSDGVLSAEECDGYGGDNLMFWTTWSPSSQASGKKQNKLSIDQQHVLKFSPIAKINKNPDTTSPTIASTSPSNENTSVSLDSSISITFSEPIDDTSVTTNTSSTSCSGTIQLSSNSFSTCVQMSSSPIESNAYKTYTISPTSSLSSSTIYKIRVTTAIKDFSGNTLSSQYETPSGFTTKFSFVGGWLKYDDDTIAIDWKSDNFIYACLVSDYTYASHGSYSSSNARINWWDNSYNSVTKSGSNILLDSAAYVPAVLTSACNPFWTKSTTENIYYTNAAKIMGFWGFTYTLIDTYTDYITMNAISSRRTNDNNYYTYGTDYFGNIVTGTYINTDNKYDILNDSGSIISQYYVFKINSSNSGITSGCYYQYSKSSSTWSSCIPMTGVKIYGTPSTYRTLNEKSGNVTINQKYLQMLEVESKQSGHVLNKKEQNDLKYFQEHLEAIDNNKDETLKKYLNSFN